MPANMRIEPLRYDPSFEVIAPDEEATNRQITETMRSISQKTFDDTGHANRAVHAKAHALLTGEMKVLKVCRQFSRKAFLLPPAPTQSSLGSRQRLGTF